MTNVAPWEGGPGSSWEAEFEALAFTAEALLAHPEDDAGALGSLAARATSVLADWEEIDADGRALKRGALRAAAWVRAADIALEEVLGQLAEDVLAASGGSPDDALYARFFPEPHEDLLEMGLDASLPVVMSVVVAVDQDTSLPEAVRAHADGLRAALQLGTGALADRADALAALGRHQARVEAWKETAQATRRNLWRALERLATARQLPPRWVRSFFLARPELD